MSGTLAGIRGEMSPAYIGMIRQTGTLYSLENIQENNTGPITKPASVTISLVTSRGGLKLFGICRRMQDRLQLVINAGARLVCDGRK